MRADVAVSWLLGCYQGSSQRLQQFTFADLQRCSGGCDKIECFGWLLPASQRKGLSQPPIAIDSPARVKFGRRQGSSMVSSMLVQLDRKEMQALQMPAHGTGVV